MVCRPTDESNPALDLCLRRAPGRHEAETYRARMASRTGSGS